MNIKNRFYTYPVLSEETNDFNTSVFEMDFSYNQKGIAALQVNVNVNLDNDNIISLIENKQAELYLHVECSLTSFRKLYKLNNHTMNSFDIDLRKINGRIEFLGLVISLNNIMNYYSDDFNEDYDNRSFELPKGSILAFNNIGYINISKNMQEFKKLESIFSITKLQSEEEVPFSVDIEGDKIKIGLPPEQHQFYMDNSSDVHYQALFNSLLILPALTYTFEQLYTSELDMYQDKLWYLALEANFERLGRSFIDELQKIENGELSSIRLAQELMEYPIKNAFDHIKLLFDMEVEEDED